MTCHQMHDTSFICLLCNCKVLSITTSETTLIGAKFLSMQLTAKTNQLTCLPNPIHMRHFASTATRLWVGEETRVVCSSKTNALMNPSPRLPSRWDQVGKRRDQAPGTSSLKTSQQGTCQAHADCMPVHAGRMLTTCSTRLAHG